MLNALFILGVVVVSIFLCLVALFAAMFVIIMLGDNDG